MIRLAVIGCGYWGSKIIRKLKSIEDAQVAAVCDIEGDKRPARENEVFVSDAEKVFVNPEIDAAIIATPIQSHYPLAKKALENNKHVFVEKPFTDSSAKCKELIKIAKKKKRILMVGHTFLYDSGLSEIKKIADSGALGKITHITTRRLKGEVQETHNVVWDLMPHDVSILLYLFGKTPKKICAAATSFSDGQEESASATFIFPDGATAQIDTSWTNPKKVRDIKIVGSKKGLVYDFVSRKITISGKKQVNFKVNEPLKAELQHFVDCVENDEKPITDGHGGLDVINTIERIQRKLK